MSYVDFFCLPLPKDKEEEYRLLAARFASVMKDFGLVSFCEAIADDVPRGKVTDWFRAVAAEETETVVAAFYVWPDKATRDKAWDLGMKDPRINHDPAAMPFDG
ncbi:MAG: hypothetical protein RJA70_1597, partial [Pseudomonadota bacterium]